MANFDGTNGDDVHTGTPDADLIRGNGGNDTLDGAGGDDDIRGGGGNDVLTGGTGQDELDGGADIDIAVFTGPRSNYIVYANAGGTIFVLDRTPGSVPDVLHNIETLRFSDGDYGATATATALGALIHVPGDLWNIYFPEPIYDHQPIATDGNDVITGTDGNDAIFSGNGMDNISAGAGDDRVEAGSGGDTISTGAGNDTIRVGYEDSVVDGGGDVDFVRIDFILDSSGFNFRPVTVDLALADNGTIIIQADDSVAKQISLTDIERFEITFGSGNDIAYGAALDDILSGDSYNFPGGQDELHGRGGNDSLYGGDNRDALYGDEGDDALNGGQQSPGFDDFDGDALHGGAGNDYLRGGNLDLFDGGADIDRANIQLTDTTADYTLDLDALAGGASVDFGDGAPGLGTRVSGLEDIEMLRLGSGADVVTGHADSFAGAAIYAGMRHELHLEGGDDVVTLAGTLRGSFQTFVDGGAGTDRLVLDGDYLSQFDLGFNTVQRFETVALAGGHDYVLRSGTAFDTATIDATGLGAGDSLDFFVFNTGPTGFRILGGGGSDSVRVEAGAFRSYYRFDLGGGSDTLILQGDYGGAETVFASETIRNVETIRVTTSIFGEGDYRFATHDDNVAAGALLTIDATALIPGFRGTQALFFNGGAELDGRFTVLGGAGADDMIGGAGGDTLDGRGGADRLEGRGGSDFYYVNNAGDQVVEAAAGGTDRVFASVSWTLTAGAQVETLSTDFNPGTAAINLTGNELANTIFGNAGANILDGKAGGDTLAGFGGNDFYYVDNSADRIVEGASEGSDRVFASVSYALAAGAYVETLGTTNNAGTGALNLTGNELANTIFGNAGANVLDGKGGADTLAGLGGNDFYYVDNVADRIVEGASEGSDRVFAGVSYGLGASVQVEMLTTSNNAGTTAINLTGNELAQSIFGNAGANVLDGKAGADTLAGFGGNDFYYVDAAADRVVEGAGEGTADRILASVSYVLGAGVQVETLSTSNNAGTGAIDLTGNELANAVFGNAGANLLDGKAGADTLAGFGGADQFRFSSALGGGNVDRLVDFVSGSDRILLDKAVFTALGGPGALNANAFVSGAAAADASDRIIYNSATGQLFYDSDGNLGGAAVLFATLDGRPALAAGDFMVI